MHQDIIRHFEDTIIHKQIIMESCWKMSRYLNSVGRDEEAIELLRKAIVHDNSKFEDDEIIAFSKIVGDRTCLEHAENKLDDLKRQVIKIHWAKNSHHPEYYDNVSDMPEIAILEMVCDLHARSIQNNTDLIEFVKIRQENRFKFPEELFQKIIEYCNIILQY